MNPLVPFFITILNFFAGLFNGSLAFSIIALTVLVKIALLPVTIPSAKSAKKMQDLKPHIDKIKLKYGKDKAKLQQAQMDLYKQHGVNPVAGCLPAVVQMLVLYALYTTFIKYTQADLISNLHLNTMFLYLDLTKPDPYRILPVITAIVTFIQSAMMQSGLESHHPTPKTVAGAKKQEDTFEMAAAMQQQTLIIMPLMILLISLNFPSALTLYWFVSTFIGIIQQYYLSGWGGLALYANKARKFILRSTNN